MKLLLDTNVLLDYYAQREPFYQDTVKLRIAALLGDVELWAAGQSFADIEYILRRAVKPQHLRAMFSESMDFLSITAAASEDYAASFTSGWPDLEDFIIAQCARRIKADYLITRDASGFADSAIPVCTPHDFFDIMENEHGIVYELIDFPED